MKLNIANPATGLQKIVEVEDEKKLLPFFEKRIGNEVPGDSIGDEFKGYIFKITGGNDKQGFPMMQGVLVNKRVRILFRKGMPCYRERRKGQKKRKSVRGCIVGSDISVLNLVLVKKGSQNIQGLTDGEKPRRLGPKRATNIRKLFNLYKDDDVRKYVIRRTIEGKGKGKDKTKAPKIQRLITSTRLQRKRRLNALVHRRREASLAAAKEYAELLKNYKKNKFGDKTLKKNKGIFKK